MQDKNDWSESVRGFLSHLLERAAAAHAQHEHESGSFQEGTKNCTLCVDVGETALDIRSPILLFYCFSPFICHLYDVLGLTATDRTLGLFV